MKIVILSFRIRVEIDEFIRVQREDILTLLKGHIGPSPIVFHY